MAVKFHFQKDRYGLEEIELKRLTLIHRGTFKQRREILLSIYALFKVLEYVKEGKFADDLWEEISFEYKYTGYGKQIPFGGGGACKGFGISLQTLCWAVDEGVAWIRYSSSQA